MLAAAEQLESYEKNAAADDDDVYGGVDDIREMRGVTMGGLCYCCTGRCRHVG